MTQLQGLQEMANDIEKVRVALETADLSDAMAKCRVLVLQSVRDNFNSQATSMGATWPARKEVGDGHPLLMDSGALMQAATGDGAGHVTRIGKRSLTVGVDKSVKEGGIPGAGVHQFGFPPKNIPARPYLSASPKHLDECGKVITAALDEAIGNRG